MSHRSPELFLQQAEKDGTVTVVGQPLFDPKEVYKK